MVKRNDATDGHVFEYVFIGAALLVVLVGSFRTYADVTIDAGGSSDVSTMATAVPDGPSLSSLRGMREVSATTPYSIDTLQQPAAPEVVLANRPATAAIHSSVTVVSGWASFGTSPADSVFVTVDGKAITGCRFAFLRADVAAAYRNPALLKSGFSCTLPPQALTPGNHALGIDVVRNGAFYRETSPTELVVQ